MSGAALLAAATREVPAALEVIWIQELGRFLEDTLQDRSQRAIRESLLVSPRSAFLLREGVEVETPLETVRSGDRIVVHGSERIPVDGRVVSGRALVDESHITGRPEPVLRARNEPVYAGTILVHGTLTVVAERVGPETYLARITRTEDDVLLVGNAAYMREQRVSFEALGFSTDSLAPGQTLVYVARNDEPMGIIGVQYGFKGRSVRVLQQLRRSGVAEIHLVSGDREAVVLQTAEHLGLTAARGDLRPEDKADYVADLVRSGRIVAMVGDGINDAPALARADVGIAMGAGGAEAAIEAADIALVDSRLDRLLFIRELSRRTLHTISWNHGFAVLTDLLSGVLAVAFSWPPILSGAAHMAHTGVLFASSARLLSQPEEPWNGDGPS